jgi:hypothetical protein
MARKDFVEQLQILGYEVEERGEDRLAFPYVIPVGRFAGKKILLGFIVHDDFPMTPPSGPHISPRLLPLHPGSDLPHPQGGVHESPFDAPAGGGIKTELWEYWSRPFPGWAGTKRTVKAYMAHIRNLFESQ